MATHKGGLVYKYVKGSRPEKDGTVCEPANSRVAVVTYTTPTEIELYSAFAAFGTIEYIKILLNKPMAYIKFARASAAARASEAADRLRIQDRSVRVFIAEPENVKTKADTASYDDKCRLYVELADRGMTESHLRDYFGDFAGFLSLRHYPEKGICYVKFSSSTHAREAMEYLYDRPHPSLEKVVIADRYPYLYPGSSSAAYGHTSTSTSGKPNPRLFIVAKGLTYEDLYPIFEHCAGLISLDVKLDSNGMPKGTAFALFSSTAEAEDALMDLNGYTIAGSPIKVMFAEEAESSKFVESRTNYPSSYPKADRHRDEPKEYYSSHRNREDDQKYSSNRDDKEERDRERVKDRDTNRDKEREKEKTREKEKEKDKSRDKDREKEREKDRDKDREKDRDKDKNRKSSPPPTAPAIIEVNDDMPRSPGEIDPDQPPESRLFYSLGAANAISEDNLISLFRKYNGLQYFQPIKNGICGFAKYESAEQASKAMEGLNSKVLAGVRLKVVLASPSTERSSKRRRAE